jgi:hypothetical protein
LKANATPFHACAFPIPKVHEATLKLEVQRLSEWAAPTFIIPKKNGSDWLISALRQLDLRIKCKPFPLPRIQDILLKLEGFKFATQDITTLS